MQKYSVLMSLYREEKPDRLELAIKSMIGQTVPPEEIVIVEDGPLPKELLEVISRFKRDYGRLFTIVVNEENLGLGLSLNKGLTAARNEMIARMDTDDISKPNRCEEQLKVFDHDKSLSIVGSCVDEFLGSPENIVSRRVVPEKNDDIYNFAKKRSPFNHPSVMFKKSDVLGNDGYSNLRRAQDLDLFGRMLFNGCRGYNIQESLVLFRVSDPKEKRKKSFSATRNYIGIIKRFWKIGYSSFLDYLSVLVIQTVLFCLPIRVQNFIVRKFLRSK